MFVPWLLATGSAAVRSSCLTSAEYVCFRIERTRSKSSRQPIFEGNKYIVDDQEDESGYTVSWQTRGVNQV